MHHRHAIIIFFMKIKQFLNFLNINKLKDAKNALNSNGKEVEGLHIRVDTAKEPEVFIFKFN